jgi:Transposase DDE domain
VATASPRHFLLIRRLISRPDQYTFHLCWAPEDRPATLTCFITIAGRRWPVEETFKTGKDVLGWDQCQARTWNAICRHTALAALAQLRQVAIRNALYGLTRLPGTGKSDPGGPEPGGPEPGEHAEPDDADLRIPLGDSPVPTYAGQPRPPQLGMIKLSVAEASRLTHLAGEFAAGLITRALLAFALRWSARRRRHQAIARWHHHNTRLTAAAT